MKVVAIEQAKPKLLTIPNLRTLDGRYRCIVRLQGHLVTAVLCAKELSPSRDFIFLGKFYSDQVSRHWCKVEDIEIVEVLTKIEEKPEPPPPWWKRVLSRQHKDEPPND